MRASSILKAKLSKSLQSIHRSRDYWLHAVWGCHAFWEGLHRAGTRLKSVFFGVDALLRGGRLSLTALGRAACGLVRAKHNIKRIDRLLGNPHLLGNLPTFCRAMTQLLVGQTERPIILVDWTRIADSHCALVASLARRSRFASVL